MILYSPGNPGSQSIDSEIHLPLPSECWDQRCVPQHLAFQCFLKVDALYNKFQNLLLFIPGFLLVFCLHSISTYVSIAKGMSSSRGPLPMSHSAVPASRDLPLLAEALTSSFISTPYNKTFIYNLSFLAANQEARTHGNQLRGTFL